MANNRWLKLCNPQIKKVQPYIAGKPESQLLREFQLDSAQVLKLNSNESLWGATPKLATAIDTTPTFYPDGDGFELKQELARYHQLNRDQITLGNGSNDVLDLIARAFLNPDTNAVYAQYAFIVYALSTQIQGATARVIAADNYAHDLSAMIKACDSDTRVIFIANPNNPTGTYLQPERLWHGFKQIPCDTLIVLDQAYQDYLIDDDTAYVDWLDEFDNLILCRSFSKIHALAAYRIGYALSSAPIADLLNRVRPPFNTNRIAQQAAIIALQDSAYTHQVAHQTEQARCQLEQGLSDLELDYIPSRGNFICCRLPNTQQVLNELMQQGIMLRSIANYQLADLVRISVGKPQHNQRLLEALNSIL